jgi:hypothetical protein
MDSLTAATWISPIVGEMQDISIAHATILVGAVGSPESNIRLTIGKKGEFERVMSFLERSKKEGIVPNYDAPSLSRVLGIPARNINSYLHRGKEKGLLQKDMYGRYHWEPRISFEKRLYEQELTFHNIHGILKSNRAGGVPPQSNTQNTQKQQDGPRMETYYEGDGIRITVSRYGIPEFYIGCSDNPIPARLLLSLLDTIKKGRGWPLKGWEYSLEPNRDVPDYRLEEGTKSNFNDDELGEINVYLHGNSLRVEQKGVIVSQAEFDFALKEKRRWFSAKSNKL